MTALLLGSIGTLADTSELQREAFNEAFRAHDLTWVWERSAYRDMLRVAGGRDRIARQAEAEGDDVDVEAIHRTKSELFQTMLRPGSIDPRPGVVETIRSKRAAGHRVALVTTTLPANVSRLLGGLSLEPSLFDLIVTADDVSAPKPDPACYRLVLDRLSLAATDCTAIEDNSDGVQSALDAGIPCLAWPNSNTEGHYFHGAPQISGDLRSAFASDRIAAQ